MSIQSPGLPTIIGAIRQWATSRPESIACTYLDTKGEVLQEMSYAALWQSAASIGTAIRREGFADKPILIACSSASNFVKAFFGCMYAGSIPIPCPFPSNLNRRKRVQSVAKNSKCSLIVTDGSAETLADLIRHESLATMSIQNLEQLRAPGQPEDCSSLDTHSPAFIQYTSGTTRAPKGVALTHENLVANLMHLHQAAASPAIPRLVSWLPPQHDMGLIGCVLAPLYFGGGFVLLPPESIARDPWLWMRCISTYRATATGAPNFALARLASTSPTQSNLHTLRLDSINALFCGAEMVQTETIAAFLDAVMPYGFQRDALIPAYGMAESTLLVSAGRYRHEASRLAVNRDSLQIGSLVRPATSGEPARDVVSCGPPRKTNDVRIVHPDSLNTLPEGSVGEIWVTGASVGQGYFGDEKESRRIFGAYCDGGRIGPFLRTGDLGFLYRGSVFPTGRIKDLIVIRGVNHHPEDIEATTQTAHPAVVPGGAAAVESSNGDGDRDFLIFAEVQRRTQAPAELSAISGRVYHQVQSEHELVPQDVILIRRGTLPRTTSGKVQRSETQRMWREGHLKPLHRLSLSEIVPPGSKTQEGSVPRPQDEPLLQYLRLTLSEMLDLPLEAVDPDRSLTHFGLDSIRATELAAKLESSFGIRVPMSSLYEPISIRHWTRRESLTFPIDVETRPFKGLPHRLSKFSHQQFQPFALTDMQEAYVIGRRTPLGAYPARISLHGYWRLNCRNLDFSRLSETVAALSERHPMLRGRLLENGAQVVIADRDKEEVWKVDASHLTIDQVNTVLRETEEHLSTRMADLQSESALRVVVVELADQTSAIYLSLDGVFIDFQSVLILLDELEVGYRLGPNHLRELFSPPEFRDAALTINAQRKQPYFETDLKSWRNKRLPLPPGPQLPKHAPTTDGSPRFRRIQFLIPPEDWAHFEEACRAHTLTIAMGTLAAYCTILSAWSETSQFSINVPVANRPQLPEGIDRTVGHFATSLPLVVDFSNAIPFQKRALEVQVDFFGAMDHRHIGGVRLLREYFKRTGEIVPEFIPVVFTFVPTPSLDPVRGVLKRVRDTFGPTEKMLSQTPNVHLDCQIWPDESGTQISWDYREDILSSGMVDEMFARFQSLLAELSHGSSAHWETSHFDPLSVQHREKRVAVNETGALSERQLLHGDFSDVADRQPSSVAIIDGHGSQRYDELLAKVNALVGLLTNDAELKGIPVIVMLQAGRHQAAAALACSIAARPYVPIDVTTPSPRAKQMCESVGTTTCIHDGDSESLDTLIGTFTNSINVTDILPDANHLDGSCKSTPDDLAYIIHTSGSTGHPKGVMMEHRAAANTVEDICERFSVCPTDRALALSSFAFDLSVFDIFGLLGSGGSIVYPDTGRERDPVHCLDLIEKHQITLLNVVPALAELLVETAERGERRIGPSLRLVLLSGDRIPPGLPHRLRKLGESLEVVSLGGATEAAIWSVIQSLSPDDSPNDAIPYGVPLRNQQLHVLHSNMSDCPPCVAGDLYISGQGLAQGYWNALELTESAFLPHPVTGVRLYRTGDRARYRDNGIVEILGRSDNQVKIHGHRIEVGEVEACLQRCDGVESAIVVPFEKQGRPSGLHAFVVLTRKSVAAEPVGKDLRESTDILGVAPPPCELINAGHLQQFVRERLPSHMCPTRVFLVPDFPLSSNGKVDRGALHRMAAVMDGTSSAVPERPMSSTERIIASTITRVTSISDLTLDQNLFELGVSSMEWVVVQTELEKEGLNVGTMNVFEYNTIRKLSAAIEMRK